MATVCGNIKMSMLTFLLTMSFLDCCFGFGRYDFEFHHRYSDRIKGVLTLDGLPEKGSPEYYKTMFHRDLKLHSRRLAGDDEKTPLTFSNGNDTYLYSSLGYLHYANISVGTPVLSYLVALDTGSDLFWLPCDCTSCVTGLKYSNGKVVNFNIYSPSNSSTSETVLCNSTMCDSSCTSAGDTTCPYQVSYLSENTSTTGYYVQDVLHLITDDNQEKASSPLITLGCGVVETGSFLEGAAPNGLLGLGMDSVSVPSVLAKKGLIANSFSMCFGSDGVGRISFGDKGTNNQGETPFYISQKNPTYNITVTGLNVGGNADNLDLNAIFDSGTSFTYLTNPSYSTFTTSFNSSVDEKRYYPDANYSIPFDYCYKLSANQDTYLVSHVNLTMKGGDVYQVTDPTIAVSLTDSASNQTINIYCLAVVKSDDIDIIGQNFMTGYRIIFDREKNVLGWKASTCYDAEDSTKTADTPAVTPAEAVDPDDTSGSGNNTAITPAESTSPNDNSGSGKNTSPGSSSSAWVKAFTLTIMLMALFMPILAFL